MVYIVYCQVFEVLYFLHFEPSLDDLSLRSDVISSIKILSQLTSLNCKCQLREGIEHRDDRPPHPPRMGMQAWMSMQACKLNACIKALSVVGFGMRVTGVPHPQETAPPEDPTVGLGPYGGTRGWGTSL